MWVVSATCVPWYVLRRRALAQLLQPRGSTILLIRGGGAVFLSAFVLYVWIPWFLCVYCLCYLATKSPRVTGNFAITQPPLRTCIVQLHCNSFVLAEGQLLPLLNPIRRSPASFTPCALQIASAGHTTVTGTDAVTTLTFTIICGTVPTVVRRVGVALTHDCVIVHLLQPQVIPNIMH